MSKKSKVNESLQEELILTCGVVEPNSTLAERTVLGLIIIYASHITDSIKTEYFYTPAHRLIFSAIISLFESGKTITINSVSTLLQSQNNLEKVGGEQYLDQITKSVTLTDDIKYYIEVLYNKWLARQIFNLSRETASRCIEGNYKVLEIIENTENELFNIARKYIDYDFKKVGDISFRNIEHLMNPQKKLLGIDTGYPELNNCTGGLHGGELIFISGRAATGKTNFALSLAKNCATISSTAVAYFSMDNDLNLTYLRILSSFSGVDFDKIKQGKINKEEKTAISNTISVLKKADIFIDSSSKLTPLEIRLKCRKLKAKNPNLNLVIVDSIQLIDTSAINKPSAEENFLYISRSLKILAIDLELPVIAVHQLNTESTTGYETDCKPQSLRILEEDSDLILYIYKPLYYS